ncbi:MAG: hypothetical protein V2B15_16080 [Bacteroidota bacterium]
MMVSVQPFFAGMIRSLVLLGMILQLPGLLLSSPQHCDREKEDLIQNGRVIDSVFCIRNPGQSYALYLPTYYTSRQSWPVVFIFEPGARGRMAADTFKLAGERFGLIVMCSNNSSNQSGAGSAEAAEAMFQDAFSRFNPDTSMLFVSGFSGASRFASDLAIQDPRVKGVIACGAGLYHMRETHSQIPGTFSYYGIMGRRDMNLPDMIETGERLCRNGIRSHIQYIDTGHEWPPSEEIAAAVAWLRFKMDSTDRDAKEFYLKFQAEKIQFMEEKELYADACERMKSIMDESPEPEFQMHLERLTNSKVYWKQIRQREKTYKQEQRLTATYLNALSEYEYSTGARPDTVHTSRWWNGEIDKLKRWESSPLIESSRLASRLLYLLEMHFSEDMQMYISNLQLVKAVFLADLWLRISPDRLWSLWNIAALYTLTGDSPQAIRLIERMISSGLARPDWFQTAPEFEYLKDEPEFIRLVF